MKKRTLVTMTTDRRSSVTVEETDLTTSDARARPSELLLDLTLRNEDLEACLPAVVTIVARLRPESLRQLGDRTPALESLFEALGIPPHDRSVGKESP